MSLSGNILAAMGELFAALARLDRLEEAAERAGVVPPDAPPEPSTPAAPAPAPVADALAPAPWPAATAGRFDDAATARALADVASLATRLAVVVAAGAGRDLWTRRELARLADMVAAARDAHAKGGA